MKSLRSFFFYLTADNVSGSRIRSTWKRSKIKKSFVSRRGALFEKVISATTYYQSVYFVCVFAETVPTEFVFSLEQYDPSWITTYQRGCIHPELELFESIVENSATTWRRLKCTEHRKLKIKKIHREFFVLSFLPF